ncbi:hydrogenase 3 maturation endopeptidase HyCI [Thermococcus thioreducens]|uniref:Hydrogenase 3 maturation endopeptidase HyCI n=1 Tax=Thermococcus thioreducens TaxID=277988 RepID=A0A0Q2RFM5_9EURY|nr:hydrogenase 3 maturation endopeptidase HyCI [Thermococcus thioreducens]ASJ11952.1 hydrogenase 3 maturation endopeptidase HyCI [Thermococcus thioreducens]KQH82822.1 hydrogenase maturation protease [Thermococcus thioreducens]SEW11081.1 Hydrogenase 3 maturation peptidase Hycl. Aspartic peptidase. MEROPS family A31 [Thermococcus thioreducens]
MELSDLLKNAERVVICGIGNDVRGDDAFGVIVAERLKELVKNPNVLILNCGEVPESYTGKIVEFKPDLVVFVDAVDFGGEHGELVIADPEGTLGDAVSTHSLPLRVLVGYLKSRTNAKFLLIGCQPKVLGLFQAPSEVIIEKAEALAGSLAELLNGM